MRRPRITKDGATYNVGAKITRGEHIFADPKMKQLYMEIISRAKKKYSFRVVTYTIMSNHVHLVIEPLEESSISRIMQYIQGTFAMIFNKNMGYSGPVWQGRFWSEVIKDPEHYVNVFAYIARNPVRASLVNDAGEWKYSGFADLIKGIHTFVHPPPNNVWEEIVAKVNQ